jgi:hypothetical protein
MARPLGVPTLIRPRQVQKSPLLVTSRGMHVAIMVRELRAAVQVPYDEGVAIHIGPEPCGGIREDGGEASAGDSRGQPLNHHCLD